MQFRWVPSIAALNSWKWLDQGEACLVHRLRVSMQEVSPPLLQKSGLFLFVDKVLSNSGTMHGLESSNNLFSNRGNL